MLCRYKGMRYFSGRESRVSNSSDTSVSCVTGSGMLSISTCCRRHQQRSRSRQQFFAVSSSHAAVSYTHLSSTLSTSWSVGRGTGAFIYAQSAVETRPVLTALRHASTALFSCRFKCPCPPRRQRHFHGNADRAYNTLHFASQSRVPNGALPPLEPPTRKGDILPLHGAHIAFSCYPALRLYRLSKSQRGIDVVSLSK